MSTSLRSARRIALVAALIGAGCSEHEPEASGDATARDATRAAATPAGVGGWSASEIALLRSLSLSALPDLPPDPSNRVAEDLEAARLGQRLFFDPSLSANGQVSCASCHSPALHFSDGRAVSEGVGTTSRNAPTVVAAAHSSWQFWDGRRDSLWAQALGPLEAAPEMGLTRLEVVRLVTTRPATQAAYAAIFGEPPDFGDPARFPPRASPYGDAEAKAAWNSLDAEARLEVNRAFANVGKALAAYERRLEPKPTRFDTYVDRLAAGDAEGAAEQLGPDEVEGLKLFVDAGRTQCLRCHNGALLTNQSFHDIGSSRVGGLDLGRFLGIQSLLLDEFNCLGTYSDAGPEDCDELRFLDRREMARLSGAFKTPTLRGVAATAPYFHNGSFDSLEAVIEHYRQPPPDPGSELTPLEMTDAEAAALASFLRVLEGGVAADPTWLAAPSLEPGSG